MKPQTILLWMCVILAVIIVLIALPGKKSPVRTPQPVVTSSTAHGGSYCPKPGAVGAAADGHTYKCVRYSDGTYRWKKQ